MLLNLFWIIIASVKWNIINITKADSINLMLFNGKIKQKKNVIKNNIITLQIKYFNWLEIYLSLSFNKFLKNNLLIINRMDMMKLAWIKNIFIY